MTPESPQMGSCLKAESLAIGSARLGCEVGLRGLDGVEHMEERLCSVGQGAFPGMRESKLTGPKPALPQGYAGWGWPSGTPL